MQPDRVLVIDLAQAAALRRSVGPTAWVVLETLVAGIDRQSRVTTGVREVATDLGLSKDTVARALVRLSRAGLVVRVDLRDERSGRFISSRYEIDLAATGLGLLAAQSTASRCPQPDERPSATSPADHQLTLLAAP